MQASYGFTGAMSRTHHLYYFFQCHVGTVINFRFRSTKGQQFRINQRTGINNHICRLQNF